MSFDKSLDKVREIVNAWVLHIVVALGTAIGLNAQYHFMNDKWAAYAAIALAFFSGSRTPAGQVPVTKEKQ